MAEKSFGLNDPLTAKLWQKELGRTVIEETYLGRFTGTGADSLIQVKTETQKTAGDRVRIGLRATPTGAGKQGNEVLEGDEEGFTTSYDDLVVDELRHAFKVPAGRTIDAQRVPYDLREEAYDLAKVWFAKRLDVSMFNQLCGYTVQSDTKYTGNQAVIAPDANHIIRAGAVANDQSLTSSDKFTLSLIDKAVERARTMLDANGLPIIKPLRVQGQDLYVCFIHDYQEADLRLDATTAGNWYDIVARALQGGQISKNPLFTGAVGMYNKTIIHVSTNITQGVHGSTGAAETDVRRAVFCGAQAAWMAFGQGYGEDSFKWVEKLHDYNKWLGVAVGSVLGLKKSTFDSADFATVTLPTYAVAHS